MIIIYGKSSEDTSVTVRITAEDGSTFAGNTLNTIIWKGEYWYVWRYSIPENVDLGSHEVRVTPVGKIISMHYCESDSTCASRIIRLV